MTAAEIYSIVKDVPREAWPKDVEHDAMYAYAIPPSPHFVDKMTEFAINSERAELMFVGSMAIEFVKRGGVIDEGPGGNGFTASMRGVEHTAPTLLEALAAACKGVV